MPIERWPRAPVTRYDAWATTMTRDQVLRSLAGLTAGAFVIGCTSSDGSGEPVLDAAPGDAPSTHPDAPPIQPDAPPTACATTMVAIPANHGHAVMVSAADVQAGVDKTYDIKGSSGHPHTITVTAAMFAMVKQGTPVTVTSSADAGHTHQVTITCT